MAAGHGARGLLQVKVFEDVGERREDVSHGGAV